MMSDKRIAMIETLNNEVDGKIVMLTPDQLLALAKKLNIRASRLKKSHLSVMRAVSEAIEKYCDESEETAINTLKEVLTDLNEHLGIEGSVVEGIVEVSEEVGENGNVGVDVVDGEVADTETTENLDKDDREVAGTETIENIDKDDREDAEKEQLVEHHNDGVVPEETENENEDEIQLIVENETREKEEKEKLEDELKHAQERLRELTAKLKDTEAKGTEKVERNNQIELAKVKSKSTSESNRKVPVAVKENKSKKDGTSDKENRSPDQKKSVSNEMSEDLRKLRLLEEEIRKKYSVGESATEKNVRCKNEEENRGFNFMSTSKKSVSNTPVTKPKPLPQKPMESSSLKNVELRSLKACWRPPLKLKGQIGGTAKDMDFIYLKRQIKAARSKDPPYEDSEIVQAIIDSVTAGTKLRRMLETSEDMTLDDLLEELKPILQDSTGKDLLADLQALRQESGANAQEFIMDGCELKNRIVKEGIVSEEVAQEMLLETLETGFSSEYIRNFMRPYLRDDIERSKLLSVVKKAMRADAERKSKFEKEKSEKKKAHLQEVEVDSVQRNGSVHQLQQQQKLLQKQIDELSNVMADVSELKTRFDSQPKNNCNPVIPCECKPPAKKVTIEYRCKTCQTAQVRWCPHCFHCGKDDHKARECPTRTQSSNSQGSLPGDRH